MPYTDKERETAVAMYTAYLEDLGRIGGRHETLRAFYLSVISALFVFLSLAGDEGALVEVRAGVLVLVGVVGMLICASWFLHMLAFDRLFGAKIASLEASEVNLPLHPFTTEKAALAQRRYIGLTMTDRIVASSFTVLFLALMLLKAG